MKRRPWILVVMGGIAALSLTCCGLGLLFTGEVLWTSGIDAFLGQVRLTRESGPKQPREYVSNELLLGSVLPSEVVESWLVPLPQEVYFWDPGYVGFPRAKLTDEEARQLLESLTSANRFTSRYGRPILCAQRSAGAEAELAACEQGPQWQAVHQETRLSAGLNPGMSVLQFDLGDGRLAEYRLYSANGLLAFSATEANQVSVEGYFPASSDALQSIAERAVVEPVGVLWRLQSPEQANAHAARLLGRRYWSALDFLRGLEPLRLILGQIREIRPAEGDNWSSTWMDGTGMQLTLRVIGDRGEGVILLQGGDCWAAEVMVQGRLYDLTSGFVCPDTQ
ncbi:MAG: hypothetical protein MUO23_09865 [Anaerolineales bacterium]|nr:hypothetical protein [Anaerolineales bacterium]